MLTIKRTQSAVTNSRDYCYAQYGAFDGEEKILRIYHKGNQWIATDIRSEEEVAHHRNLEPVKAIARRFGGEPEPEIVVEPGVPAHEFQPQVLPNLPSNLETEAFAAKAHLVRLASWGLQFYGQMWPKEPLDNIDPNHICGYSLQILRAFYPSGPEGYRAIGVPEKYLPLLMEDGD